MPINFFNDINLNNQDILNAANISGGGGGGGITTGARVTKTLAQTFTYTSFQRVEYDNVLQDDESYWDNVNNEFVVPSDGWYIVAASAGANDIENNSTFLAIQKNATAVDGLTGVRIANGGDISDVAANADFGKFLNISTVAYLSAGDTLSVHFNSSGTGSIPFNLTTATNEIYFAIAKLSGGGGREVLTANRTYYVATTGSDSNDGLTPGSAFQTVQKAIDTAAGLDLDIYDVTIQLADGTYPTSTTNVCKQCAGSGNVIIQGNNGTPSNVKLEITAISVYAFSITNISTIYVIKDLEVDINHATTGGGATGLLLCTNSYIEVENTVSKATNGVGKPIQWFRAADNGNINVTGNLTFDDWSGGSPSQYYAFVVIASSVSRCQNKVITLLNTPDFLSGVGFVNVSRNSVCFLNGTTYSGSAVGRRFEVDTLGYLEAGAAGANLPGDVAGIVDAATYGVVI